MTRLETFGHKLATLDPRAYAPADRAALETHMVDSVAASIVGATTSEGDSALSFLAHGLSGPLDEIATRVAVTRATEIDDIHLPSGTTPGSIIVPSALCVGGILGLQDSYTFAAAICAGYEAMTRLGRTVNGQAIGYRGIWATYFCAPFATAAVTARLLGLDGEKTAHALAIALTMSAGRAGPTVGGRAARWLLAGEAARAGCKAALAASDGYRGDLGLLDGSYLSAAHGIEPDFDPLSAEWSTSALAQTSIKPFCSAKQLLAAVAGFEAILARGIDARTIDKVHVSVPPDFVAMTGHGIGAGNRLSSITSAPYQMALAALRRDALYDVARDPFVMTDEIADLMKKITVSVEDGLADYLPNQWPARIEVVAGPRTETILILDAPGDPAMPFSIEDVAAKFHAAAGKTLDAAAIDGWVERARASVIDDDALEELQTEYLGFGR